MKRPTRESTTTIHSQTTRERRTPSVLIFAIGIDPLPATTKYNNNSLINIDIMENHTFSDPVPVKDASSPTWTVDVIRLSGNVLVGTLTVNNETLPPRKTKKKIAWRLPDDPEVLPKFGEHERKRLWELFKEQKKERRRQSKKLSTQQSLISEDGSNYKEEETEQGAGEPTAPTTVTANSTPDHSVAEEGLGPDDDGGPKTPEKEARERENGTPDNESQHPPPPSSSPFYQEKVLPPPPPGFNVEKMKQDAPVHVETPALAPPPASAPPPSQAPTGPPPGLAATPPDSSLPPKLYFTLADDQPLAALKSLVVPFFVQCVTTSTVVPWLAHSHPTMSQTTLSLGTAQATGRTYLDRLQQWQSLTLSTSWDCTGCVSQTLPTPSTVMLVLTGRTIQKQECLAYHLSLVLTAAVNTRNFQITNECLSLTALTNVPLSP